MSHEHACTYVPGAGDELDDGAEEEEGAVEGEADVPPVPPQQPVQHLEPLRITGVLSLQIQIYHM